MKETEYAEIYLWNRGVDRLVRVLQRLETEAILPKRELKAFAMPLEEIRAGLNAEFAEATLKRERADHLRLQRQRVEWEKQTQLRASSAEVN